MDDIVLRQFLESLFEDDKEKKILSIVLDDADDDTILDTLLSIENMKERAND